MPAFLTERGEDVLNTLQLILVILSILTALVALIRVLILTPLDRKLESHSDRMLVTIEHRFLDVISKRLDGIEALGHARSRQGILWGKAVHQSLSDQGITIPDPSMYVWDPEESVDRRRTSREGQGL